MSTNKFKVGDIVEYKHSLYSSVKFNIGDKFKVARLDSRGNLYLEPIDNPSKPFGSYTTDQFELVESKPTFKAGEQVRCVTDCYQHLTFNQVYTVSRVYNGRYLVRTDSGRTIGCPEWVFAAVEPKPKFKVGDVVRCIRDMSNLEIGKVYTVVSVSSDNYWYRVVNDLGATVGYEADNFELVQDAVLTPEEVFKHLRKGTKLQHRVAKYGWQDVETPAELYYEDICNERFRVKPKPEVIELNGKKYREIME